MNIKELEAKLSDLHATAAKARDSAQAVLKELAELRSWMTQQEIQRLRSKAAEKGQG